MPNRRINLLAAAAAALALLVAGCSSKPTPPPSSWLGTEPDGGVTYLHWDNAGKDVQGEWTAAEQDPGSQYDVRTAHGRLTGSVVGSAVDLDAADIAQTLTGKIHGRTAMDLSYTDSDGTIKTIHFHPASTNDYNHALTGLKASLSDQQQQAAQAQAQSDADSTIEQDIAAARSALGSLHGDVKTGLADDFGSDVDSARHDLQTEQSDLATVRREGARSIDCGSDASTVDADSDTVDSDSDTITSDSDTTDSDIGSMQNDVNGLKAAVAKLTTDEQGDTSYASQAPFDTAGAAALEKRAAALITADEKRSKSEQAQAASLVAQAQAVASQADSVCD